MPQFSQELLTNTLSNPYLCRKMKSLGRRAHSSLGDVVHPAPGFITVDSSPYKLNGPNFPYQYQSFNKLVNASLWEGLGLIICSRLVDEEHPQKWDRSDLQRHVAVHQRVAGIVAGTLIFQTVEKSMYLKLWLTAHDGRQIPDQQLAQIPAHPSHAQLNALGITTTNLELDRTSALPIPPPGGERYDQLSQLYVPLPPQRS